MRQVTAIVSLSLTLIAGVYAQPVLAKKPDWAGQGKQEHTPKESEHSAVEKVESGDAAERFDNEGFSSYERARIRGYFLEGNDESGVDSKGQGRGKDKSRSLPRGLQKKLARGGELPPGWQKKVAAGEVLDEELYDGSEALPDDLDLILNRTGGAEYRRIGTKVIKVLEGDGTIIDVIDIADGVLSGSTE
ncbi:hypothetical protein [Amphritea sp. HPY]|uniref:hypothetical protein n=1 Tax=Amphritea sp. HPY TaxID=3421652 RepID=UPI003D7DC3E6